MVSFQPYNGVITLSKGSCYIETVVFPEFSTFNETILAHVKEALGMCAEDLAEKSQELVPLDTGRLQTSCTTREVKDGFEVIYSAKNPKDGYDYARIQHNVPYNHPNGRQWHYVSDPHNENREYYRGLIETAFEEGVAEAMAKKRQYARLRDVPPMDTPDIPMVNKIQSKTVSVDTGTVVSQTVNKKAKKVKKNARTRAGLKALKKMSKG